MIVHVVEVSDRALLLLLVSASFTTLPDRTAAGSRPPVSDQQDDTRVCGEQTSCQQSAGRHTVCVESVVVE